MLSDDEYEALLNSVQLPKAPVPRQRATALPPQPRGNLLTDLAAAALKGAVVDVPNALIGLADIPTGGYVGKGFEALGKKTGFSLDRVGESIESTYSPAQKAALAEVEQAKGFFPTLGAYLANPRAILADVAGSLGPVGAGRKIATGLIGSGLKAFKGAKGAITAGAIGEGAMTAGSMAEGVRSQTEGGTLSPRQALAALGAGAGNALIGRFSGGAANRLGIGDIDVPGSLGTSFGGLGAKEYVKRVGKGVITEGALEELPQNVVEQIATNLALGKPAFEGVGGAAASGVIVGGAMGGAFNAIPRPSAIGTPAPSTNPPGTPPSPPSTNPPGTPPSPPPASRPGEMNDLFGGPPSIVEYDQAFSDAAAELNAAESGPTGPGSIQDLFGGPASFPHGVSSGQTELDLIPRVDTHSGPDMSAAALRKRGVPKRLAETLDGLDPTQDTAEIVAALDELLANDSRPNATKHSPNIERLRNEVAASAPQPEPEQLGLDTLFVDRLVEALREAGRNAEIRQLILATRQGTPADTDVKSAQEDIAFAQQAHDRARFARAVERLTRSKNAATRNAAFAAIEAMQAEVKARQEDAAFQQNEAEQIALAQYGAQLDLFGRPPVRANIATPVEEEPEFTDNLGGRGANRKLFDSKGRPITNISERVKNAAQKIPKQKSVQPKPEGRAGRRKVAKAGAGDSVRSEKAGEEKVTTKPKVETPKESVAGKKPLVSEDDAIDKLIELTAPEAKLKTPKERVAEKKAKETPAPEAKLKTPKERVTEKKAKETPAPEAKPEATTTSKPKQPYESNEEYRQRVENEQAHEAREAAGTRLAKEEADALDTLLGWMGLRVDQDFLNEKERASFSRLYGAWKSAVGEEKTSAAARDINAFLEQLTSQTPRKSIFIPDERAGRSTKIYDNKFTYERAAKAVKAKGYSQVSMEKLPDGRVKVVWLSPNAQKGHTTVAGIMAALKSWFILPTTAAKNLTVVQKWSDLPQKVRDRIGEARKSVADIRKLIRTGGESLEKFADTFASRIKQKDMTIEDADRIAKQAIDDFIANPKMPEATGADLKPMYMAKLIMPDGTRYDPGNLAHANAPMAVTEIHRAVQEGSIDGYLQRVADRLNAERKENILRLARYLKDNNDYTPTTAALILEAARKYSVVTTGREVQVVNIAKNNEAKVMVVDGTMANRLAEELRKGLPLKKALGAAVVASIEANKIENRRLGRDGWVKFGRSDKYEDAVELNKACAGTSWCTGGAVDTALAQRRNGDFHIFFKDGKPFVAVRMEGDVVGEIAGATANQSRTPEMDEVVEKALRSGKIKGGENFLHDQVFIKSVMNNTISDIDIFLTRHPTRKMRNGYGDNQFEYPPSVVRAIAQERKNRKLTEDNGFYELVNAHNVTQAMKNAVVIFKIDGLPSRKATYVFEAVEAVGNIEGNSSNINVSSATTVGVITVNSGNVDASNATTVGNITYNGGNVDVSSATRVGEILSNRDSIDASSATRVGHIRDNRGSVDVSSATTVGGIKGNSGGVDASSAITVGEIKYNIGNVDVSSATAVEHIINNSGNVDASSATRVGTITDNGGNVDASSATTVDYIATNKGDVDVSSATTVGEIRYNSGNVDVSSATTVGEIVNNIGNVDASSATTVGNIVDNSGDVDASSATTVGDIERNKNDVDVSNATTVGDIIGNRDSIDAPNATTVGAIKGNGSNINVSSATTVGDIRGNKGDVDASSATTVGDIRGNKGNINVSSATTVGNIERNKNDVDVSSATKVGDIKGNEGNVDASSAATVGEIKYNSGNINVSSATTVGNIADNEGNVDVSSATTVGNIEDNEGSVDVSSATTVGNIANNRGNVDASSATTVGNIAGNKGNINVSSATTVGNIERNKNDVDVSNATTVGNIERNRGDVNASNAITVGDIEGNESNVDVSSAIRVGYVEHNIGNVDASSATTVWNIADNRGNVDASSATTVGDIERNIGNVDVSSATTVGNIANNRGNVDVSSTATVGVTSGDRQTPGTAAQFSKNTGDIQAFVLDGHAYMIADHIPAGAERAVFLHEVGAHIGLTTEQVARAAAKVKKWASRPKGSQERKVYDATIARMEAAGEGSDSELVAYATEEAVKAGITPKAVSAVGKFLQLVKAFFDAALLKLYGTVNMTAQDLVDLTFGAVFGKTGQTSTQGNLQFSRAANPTLDKINKTSTQDNLQFSRAANPTLDKINKGLSEVKNLWAPAKSTLSSKIDSVKLFTMTLSQINASFGRLFKGGSLAKVVKAINDMTASRISRIRLGEDIENLHQRLIPQHLREQVHKVMAAATAVQMYPDKTLAENQRLGLVVDDVNIQEYAALLKQYNAVKAAFEQHKAGSSADFETVFKAMYKFGADSYTEKLRLIENNFNKLHAAQVRDAQKLNSKAAMTRLAKDKRAFELELGVLRNHVKGPYFPYSRFGEHLLLTTSQKYRDARDAAEAARSQYEKLLGDDDIIEFNNAARELARMKAHLLAAKKQGNSRVAGLLASEVVDQTAKVAAMKSAVAKKLEAVKAARLASKTASKTLDAMKSNGAEYRVQAFENEMSRNVALAKAKRDITPEQAKAGVTVYASSAMENISREMLPATRSFLDNVFEAVKGSMSPEMAANVRGLMATVLTQMSINDTIRRQLRRKGVAGFEPDMLRSFSAMVRADAHFLSRLEHGGAVNDAFSEMREEAKSDTDRQSERIKVFNMIQRHVERMYDYSGRSLEGKLAQLTSAWMLLTSPAYVLTNALQQWVVALPVLAGRFGAQESTVALARGTAKAMQLMQASARNPMSGGSGDSLVKQWINFQLDPEAVAVHGDNKGKAILTKDQVALINEMTNAQLIDISISSDAGLASNEGSSSFHIFRKALGTAPHLTEVANRVGMALAAYELFKKQNPKASETDAYAYVARVLDNAHLNYSAENEPLFMKKIPFAHVLFQFKKYTEGMLYLVGHNAVLAFSGKKPEDVSDKQWREERAVARATLKYLAGTHFLAAGILGVPFSGTIFAIADVLAAAIKDDDEEPWDTELELRQLAAKYLGEDAGLLLAKGVFAYMGVDMSQRSGLGNLLNPMPFADRSKEGREFYNNAIVATLGGPFFGGLLPRFVEGASQFNDGDYAKGITSIMPALPANIMRAFRTANEGITTKYGNTTLGADRFSGVALWAKALGFTPTVESEFRAGQSAVMDAQKHFQRVVSDIKDDYIRAKLHGDVKGVRDAVARLRTVNKDRARYRMRPVTIGDLQKALVEQRRYQNQLNKKGIRVRRSEGTLAKRGSFAAVE